MNLNYVFHVCISMRFCFVFPRQSSFFFRLVHSIALWDEDGASKVRTSLSNEITKFIKEAQRRVMQHQEDSALLKAYITEWRQFFTQCDYLPLPFQPLETVLGKAHLSGPKKNNYNESIVRKVSRKAHMTHATNIIVVYFNLLMTVQCTLCIYFV